MGRRICGSRLRPSLAGDRRGEIVRPASSRRWTTGAIRRWRARPRSRSARSARSAIGHLAPMLEHAEAAVRFDAADALAELGDPAGRETLINGLGDAERVGRGDGAVPPSAPPRTPMRSGAALSNRRVPPEATVLAAGTILGIAPRAARTPRRARRVLLAALKSRQTHVRGLAVELIGGLERRRGRVGARAAMKLARSGKGGELLGADRLGAARARRGGAPERDDRDRGDPGRPDGPGSGCPQSGR